MTVDSLLLKEKVLEVSKLPIQLKGFVRLTKGSKTMGFFLDQRTFSELIELIEYSHPKFWEEIKESRQSDRVSSKRIEKELGIK